MAFFNENMAKSSFLTIEKNYKFTWWEMVCFGKPEKFCIFKKKTQTNSIPGEHFFGV